MGGKRCPKTGGLPWLGGRVYFFWPPAWHEKILKSDWCCYCQRQSDWLRAEGGFSLHHHICIYFLKKLDKWTFSGKYKSSFGNNEAKPTIIYINNPADDMNEL